MALPCGSNPVYTRGKSRVHKVELYRSWMQTKYPHGVGQAYRNVLACYFQTLGALVASLLFIFMYQEGGSAFAPCCHPVTHGEPSGNAANASLAYVIHRAWFGSFLSPFICSCFHKAIWHLQLCWQRNVLRMSVRKCKKQKIFSQLFNRASLPA